MTQATHFETGRKDLRVTRFASQELTGLQPGQVLLRVDRFAFTANNVTYAVFGDAMAYWAFFPGPEGWGHIPVWGFAEVAESRHEAIAAGERLFGYLPMSTHLVVQPDKIAPGRFMDASAHRRPLPAPYQQYLRLAAVPGHRADLEDHMAIFRPLFSTSFMIQDFLADHAMFGARRIVLSSASSKTALGLAHVLTRNRAAGCEVVGLSSAGNVAFCERTGYYDRVLPYESLRELDATTPTVFVDMAGNGQLLHDVHHHFGDALRHSAIVGASHWEKRQTQHSLPGAKPAFFFAPTQIAKRSKEWGPAELERRLAEAMQAFVETTASWLQVRHGRGREAIEATYREVLEGRAKPSEGHVLAF